MSTLLRTWTSICPVVVLTDTPFESRANEWRSSTLGMSLTGLAPAGSTSSSCPAAFDRSGAPPGGGSPATRVARSRGTQVSIVRAGALPQVRPGCVDGSRAGELHKPPDRAAGDGSPRSAPVVAAGRTSGAGAAARGGRLVAGRSDPKIQHEPRQQEGGAPAPAAPWPGRRGVEDRTDAGDHP